MEHDETSANAASQPLFTSSHVTLVGYLLDS
jgi:hypothetical protein